jgi:hypothetical protein
MEAGSAAIGTAPPPDRVRGANGALINMIMASRARLEI